MHDCSYGENCNLHSCVIVQSRNYIMLKNNFSQESIVLIRQFCKLGLCVLNY